jgi:peptidoglycan hydrolase CwlO-like protein
MSDKEGFILSELKRLKREIDVLKEVYAHYLDDGLKREERVKDAMDKTLTIVEEVAEAVNEQLRESIRHSKEPVEKIGELEEKIGELEEKIGELEEKIGELEET